MVEVEGYMEYISLHGSIRNTPSDKSACRTSAESRQDCQDPAPAESRGSLQMSSVSKEKKASRVLDECRIKTSLSLLKWGNLNNLEQNFVFILKIQGLS